VRPTRGVRSRSQVRGDAKEHEQDKAFQRFVRKFKEGDVVSATVFRSKFKNGKALLEGGVKAFIDDCLDHEDGKKVNWIPVPPVGQRIQVYVRSIRRENRHISVSIHTFTQDEKFNLFNIGYRSAFDGTAATFALLPWEKPWLDRVARRG
jgi:ribosomal protein S1